MKGEKNLPEKSFLLTFDDGRKDSYYPVDPILKALDYRAIMFVISGRSLGDEKEVSPFYLSSSELKRMQKAVAGICNHTAEMIMIFIKLTLAVTKAIFE